MKINVSNREKLQDMLDSLQSRCKERCYSAENIQDIAHVFVEHLSKAGIPRCKMDGCSVEFGGNYHPANSYKYPFVGTMGVIRLSKTDAFVTSLVRGRCNCSTRAVLTDDAKKAMASSFEDSQMF